MPNPRKYKTPCSTILLTIYWEPSSLKMSLGSLAWARGYSFPLIWYSRQPTTSTTTTPKNILKGFASTLDNMDPSENTSMVALGMYLTDSSKTTTLPQTTLSFVYDSLSQYNHSYPSPASTKSKKKTKSALSDIGEKIWSAITHMTDTP